VNEQQQRRREDARNDDGSSLSLPVGIHNGALLLANVLVVPLPGLGVDRLSDGSDGAEGGEVVALDVLGTEATEETDGGRGGVELQARASV
jgi:hypothetical protein